MQSEIKKVMIKFCSKCQDETEWYERGECKVCVKAASTAWRAANLDRAKASSKAWRLANQEKQAASKAAWCAANKDRVKSTNAAYRSANKDRTKKTGAAYYAANQEKRKAYGADYRAKNQDKERARTSAWAKANPESLRIQYQNRQARKRANGGVLSKDLSTKLFKLQRGKCACCGLPLGKRYHLDHIVPIDLGGPNTDDNIQLLRSTCNQQKHAKYPVDFMQERGFLL